MNPLLHMALGNALVAAVLGVLVAGISRVCRRPALVHCLWVLVLLKLITPSFVAYRIPWPAEPEPVVSKLGVAAAQIGSAKPATEPSESDPGSEAVSTGAVAELALSHEPAVSPAMAPLVPEIGAPQSVMREPSTPVAPSAFDQCDSVPRGGASLPWIPLLGGIWIIGSTACFILITCRIARFQRLLHCARLASPKLQEQAQRLAQCLGLAACPTVSFVPGRVSPMVWALGGRPRLFVPSALWERLSEEQQTTLLVHELAHLRRRDHWVRGLEFIATVLYWWHPVVWWACREIRETEEQCCDAWVVWTVPRAARAYATALLATIDFLCETQNALPAVASGIGHVHDLRRRLTMIMHGTTPRALSGPGLLLVLGLGALLLPWLPTWAQGQSVEPRDPRAAQEAVEQRQVAEEERRLADQAQEQAQRAEREEATRNRRMAEERERALMERQVAEREVEEMKRHVENMKREFQRAMEQLEAAQKRLGELQAKEGRGRREPEGGRAQTSPRPSPRREGAPDAERRLSELERKLDALLQEVQSLRREMRRSGPSMKPEFPGVPGRVPVPGDRPHMLRPGTPVPAVPSLPPTPHLPPAPVAAPVSPVAPATPAPAALPAGEKAPAPVSNPDPRPAEAPSSFSS